MVGKLIDRKGTRGGRGGSGIHLYDLPYVRWDIVKVRIITFSSTNTPYSIGTYRDLQDPTGRSQVSLEHGKVA